MPALIFDVDGTLAETEELHRQAFNRAFADQGIGWQWDEALYRDLLKVTGGKERILAYAQGQGGMSVPDAARLHAAKTRHYVDAVDGGRLALRPGIAALIDEARARGVALAIATTTSRDNVDSLLAHTLGPDHGFDVIACGDMVPAKKPAPDIYELALRMLGMPAGECLAIEDSANGLQAAKAAGLRCVVTPALYTVADDFTGAQIIVDGPPDPRQILAMLGL